MIVVLDIEHNQLRNSCQGRALQINFSLLQTAHFPANHEVNTATVSEIWEGTPEGRTSKKLPKGVKVIDVDVHAHETPAALISYREMPWRKSVELIGKGRNAIWIFHFCSADGSLDSSLSAERERTAPGGRPRHLKCRKDLDELGIDIGVIFSRQLGCGTSQVRNPSQ
jgi:hypothetical protein